MTVRPDHRRFQITIPQELRARIGEVAEAAGISANAVAATWLAQAAQSWSAAPVVDDSGQRKGRTTSSEKLQKSAAPPGEDHGLVEPVDDWEAPEEDDGFSAAEVLEMMEPAEREALLAAGWTAESSDEFLEEDEG